MKTSNRRMEDWRQIDRYICPVFAVFEAPVGFSRIDHVTWSLTPGFEMLPLFTNKLLLTNVHFVFSRVEQRANSNFIHWGNW